MKVGIKGYFVVCAATLACSAGCAKHELVKQDQIIPPVAASAPAPAPATTPVEAKTKPNDAGLNDAALKESQPQPAPVADEVALKDALQKVFFDFDSSTLTERSRAALTKNAELLKRETAAKIRIEGNCDERGSDDYNLALGERRAKAAKEYLQNLGIAADRLTTISYGKEKPAVAGHDEAAMSRNRRDEFVIAN